MLKVECAKCNKWIHLPFHGEVRETRCPGCGAVIPVKDVYIAAGPFMIYREVLLKNMHKYKRLLAEAEKEMTELKDKGHGQKTYDVSANSVKMFITNLKELLDGCRGKVRHQLMEECPVEYSIHGQTLQGKIVNISLSGVCIDMGSGAPHARPGDRVSVSFKADDKTGHFSIEGEIAWIGKGNQIGVRFSDIPEKSQELIQEYIIEKSLLLQEPPKDL